MKKKKSGLINIDILSQLYKQEKLNFSYMLQSGGYIL